MVACILVVIWAQVCSGGVIVAGAAWPQGVISACGGIVVLRVVKQFVVCVGGIAGTADIIFVVELIVWVGREGVFGLVIVVL